MLSLRQRFAADAGFWGKPPVSLRQRFPGAFRVGTAGSLSLLKALGNGSVPDTGQWGKLACERHDGDSDWARQCEGITTDGSHWYITSNYLGALHKTPLGAAGGDHSAQGVYKLSLDWDVQAFYQLGIDAGHVGAPTYHGNRLYLPVQDPHCVVIMDPADGQLAGVMSPHGVDDGLDIWAWCAVSPWNGYLYSSEFAGPVNSTQTYTGRLRAFDMSNNLAAIEAAAIPLGRQLGSIQGGCFTPNGHLLLSSDDSHDISCFSAFSGEYYGATGIQVSNSTWETQEVQGLCFIDLTVSCEDNNNMPQPAQIHLVLLGNEHIVHDEVWVKHYTVPDPAHL